MEWAARGRRTSALDSIRWKYPSDMRVATIRAPEATSVDVRAPEMYYPLLAALRAKRLGPARCPGQVSGGQ